MEEVIEAEAPVASNDSIIADLNAQAEAALEQALAGKEAPPEPAAAPAAKAPEPVAPAAPSPVEADLNARIQAAAKLEAEAVRQRSEAKAELEALRAEAAQAKAAREALEREVAENPLKVLERHKWSLESLVQHAASRSTPDAVAQGRLADEVAAVKAELAKRDAAAQAERAQAEAVAAQRQLKETYIPEKLREVQAEIPTLSAWLEPAEVVEAVYGLMGREYQRTNGRGTLEPQEAARQLETQLRARVQRLPGAQVTPAKQAPSTPAKPVQPSRTVTNELTQSRGAQPVANPYDQNALNARAVAELAALLRSSE